MTRTREGLGNPIGGGMDTTRSTTPATPEEAAAREAVRADALAYLNRTGNGDIAEILGLTGGRAVSRSQSAIFAERALPFRTCPECGEQFSPSTSKQRNCGTACGNKVAARARSGKRTAQNLDEKEPTCAA